MAKINYGRFVYLLFHRNLDKNALSGTLPTEIGQMTFLYEWLGNIQDIFLFFFTKIY
jgi:hypothetical protein